MASKKSKKRASSAKEAAKPARTYESLSVSVLRCECVTCTRVGGKEEGRCVIDTCSRLYTRARVCVYFFLCGFVLFWLLTRAKNGWTLPQKDLLLGDRVSFTGPKLQRRCLGQTQSLSSSAFSMCVRVCMHDTHPQTARMLTLTLSFALGFASSLAERFQG